MSEFQAEMSISVVSKLYLLRDEEIPEDEWETHVEDLHDWMGVADVEWDGDDHGVTIHQDGEEIFAPQGSWLLLMEDGSVVVSLTDPDTAS
jgi:hypothetical protein